MNHKEKLYLVKSAKSPISARAILALLGGGLGGGLGALMASRNNNLKDMSLAGLTGASLGGLTGYGLGALEEHLAKMDDESRSEEMLWRAQERLEDPEDYYNVEFDTKEQALEYMSKHYPEMWKRYAQDGEEPLTLQA